MVGLLCHLVPQESRAASIVHAAPSPASAAEPVDNRSASLHAFVVKDIRVEGIQRTEAGTVFNYLPIKVGERFEPAQAPAAIKALFATGFYNDVRLEVSGDTLIVQVDERPVITSITLKGTKELDSEQLTKAMRETGLAEGQIFDPALLAGASLEIRRQYYNRGKYNAQVKVDTIRQDRNRIALVFDISEGLTTRIREIGFVGNEQKDDDTLLGKMQLTPPGWWTWFTKNDQYAKSKFLADTEAIRSYYLDQGYLEFNMGSQQVALSEDKLDIFLTTHLSEGQQYTIRELRFAGRLILPEAELRVLLKVEAGEVFSRQKLNKGIEAITNRLGDESYAFARVNAVPTLDREHATVSLTLYVEPGVKTSIRQIHISGNDTTRDEVIRRELRLLEGAPYAAWKLRRSRERLNLLGFFSSVSINLQPVTGTPDQIDLAVEVAERSTGSLQLGVGYAPQQGGFIITGSVSKSNIFGTGNTLALSLNTSTTARNIDLSYTNPYVDAHGSSRGYDLYQRHYEPNSNLTTVSRYVLDTYGAGMRWATPVSEYDSLRYGLSAEYNELQLFDTSPFQYAQFAQEHGQRYTTVLSSLGWARDLRNSAIFPTEGQLWQINGNLSVPLADIKYWKASAQQQWFFPIPYTEQSTLLWNLEGGIAGGYGGQTLPFYANFYAGGPDSVHGYDPGSLGPQVNDNGTIRTVGGNRRLVSNLELYFPVPGTDSPSVRFSAFVDGGTVWGANQPVVWNQDPRYSYGAAFSWYSPLGPMKFSYAWPINNQPNDLIQSFQFTLGRVF